MKQNSKFIIFTSLLFFLIYLLENINGRFWLNDFKVYFLAAKALLANEQVYGVPFGLGTGFYKYSPAILLPFVPYTFLPFQLASSIHFLLISVSTIASFLVIQNLIKLSFPKTSESTNLLFLFGLICILNHLFRELHLGNVNVIVVLFLSSGLLLSLKNQQYLAGSLIAIAVLAKPYLIILALPLLFHKKIKTLLSLTFSLLASVLLMILLFGFPKTISLHSEWVKAVMGHGTYLSSNHTIPSLLSQYFNLELSSSFQYLLLLFVLSIYGILYFIYIKPQVKSNKGNDNSYLTLAYFIFLSLIPNLLITDTEHFLFSLPIILILLNELFIHKKIISISLFILFVLFYGGNSDILIGSDNTAILEKYGSIGLANLALLILVLTLKINSKKNSLQNA